MMWCPCRLLWFDKAAGQFGDVTKSDFHASCVLQLAHVIYRRDSATHSSAVVFSAGTDGRICVWDVTRVVMDFCQKYRSSDTRHECEDNPALNVVADDDKCITSLTETGCIQCYADNLQHTEASDTLGAVHRTKSNDRRAVFDGNTSTSEEANDSERQGSDLTPCCVMNAHQSGINSLAVRLSVSGFLCYILLV